MKLGTAYFPWVGALHSLLDSLADRVEDLATGKRGLIDYYHSPDEAADRIATIANEAMSQVSELPGGHSHTLIVAAMTSFYLCDLSMSSSPHARLATPAVLEAMGRLARPTMLILSARRATGRVPDDLGYACRCREGLHTSRPAERTSNTRSVRQSLLKLKYSTFLLYRNSKVGTLFARSHRSMSTL